MVKQSVVLTISLLFCHGAAAMFMPSSNTKNCAPTFSILLTAMSEKPLLKLPGKNYIFEKNSQDVEESMRIELRDSYSATYRCCKLLHEQKNLEKLWCKKCPFVKQYVSTLCHAEYTFFSDGFEDALKVITDALPHAPCILIKHKYLVLEALFLALQDFWPVCYLEEACNTPTKQCLYTHLRNALLAKGAQLFEEKGKKQ